jgi:hypothetical protein
VPFLAVGDDVQQPLCRWHVVGITGGHGLPGVAGRVDVSETERFQEPGFAVGAMVGQGLAGPLAGDQDAPSGVAEVLVPVCLAGAPSGAHALMGVLGLDAVAQPVGARRRARLAPERVGQPLGVLLLGAGGRLVAVGDVLGEVFRQVADAAGRVLRSAEYALSVELRPEPGDMQRLVIGTDGVERLVPGRQELAVDGSR